MFMLAPLEAGGEHACTMQTRDLLACTTAG